MDLILSAIDFFLHLDVHLAEIISQYGVWTYLILFGIVFAETGFVVTPFLPGDSLIFAAATLAAKYPDVLNPVLVFLIFCAAAIAGDSVNYAIGHAIGPRVFREDVRFLKREYLDRTHEFYEKHGGMTIILARFMPIIRTFAPFVAGVGAMTYGKFILYNVIGGVAWVGLFTILGHFFGSLQFVQDNFSVVVLAIIFLSVLPPIFEILRTRMATPKPEAE